MRGIGMQQTSAAGSGIANSGHGARGSGLVRGHAAGSMGWQRGGMRG